MKTIEHIVQKPQKRTHSTPLLFQHGAWHGAWCWQQWMNHFSSLGYEVHAISLPAHGNSPSYKLHLNFYTLNDYVEILASQVETISPAPVVIGHSMGGAILQKYLENHQLPAAVLLASLPSSGSLQMVLRLLKQHPLPIWMGMFKMNLYEWVKTPELAQALFLNPETNIDIIAFHKKLVRESAYPFSHLFPFAKSNPNKSPVLVISGERDAIFTVEEENITAKKFDARNIVIEGQAHNLMMESAQEQVANIIDNWITNELQLS